MRSGKCHKLIGCRNGRFAFAVIGYAILILLLKGGLGSTSRPIVPVASPILVASNAFGQAKTSGVTWYIQSGQWRADLRSLTAVLHYLAEPQIMAQTNSLPANAEIDDRCGCQPSFLPPLALVWAAGADNI